MRKDLTSPYIKNMLPQSLVIMINVNDNLSYDRYIVGVFGSAGSFPVIFYSSITWSEKKKKASEIGIQLMNFSGRNTFFFISTCKIMSLQIVKKY